jgi:glycosyltransferase involved in cell wall biosynthesis
LSAKVRFFIETCNIFGRKFVKKGKIPYLCNVMEKIIGFDAKRIVRNATGLGNYGRTLVADLHREAPARPLLLFAPDAGRDALRLQLTEDDTLRYVYPSGRKPWRWQRDLWRVRGIVDDLQQLGVQIFHGLTGELPHGLRRAGIRSVVTIHDLIFLRHPEYYHWIDVQIYRQKFRHAISEADRIIAISERTKQDIVELGGIPPERIDVIYQSCARLFQNNTLPESTDSPCASSLTDIPGLPPLSGPMVLSVGSIEARKNLLLVVKALEHLPEEVHLVAVGRQTPYARQVADYAQHHRLAHRVHLLHDINDAQLSALYQSGTVFAYPSRYEGFGIPIIEAIGSGLPMMAATGSCLEEAGGPDGLYVDPDDVEGAAHALSQLISEGRDSERCRRQQQYIEHFNNAGVARQVLNIYDQLS